MVNPFGSQSPAAQSSASVPQAAPQASAAPATSDFDLIANAQMFQSSPKMNPEHTYVLDVEKMLWKRSGRNSAITNFILEAVIVETDDPAYSPGKVVGHVEATNKQGFEGRILAILCSCIGIDPSDQKKVDETRPFFADGLRSAVGPENPMKGKRIVCKTGAKQIAEKSQKAYTPTAFYPYTP